MQHKRAAIFDMDGVICHTNPYHAEAFRIFFKKRGVSATEEDFKKHMYGKNNSYILSHFLGRPIQGQELLSLEEEKEGLFRDIYRSKVEPIRGFLTILNHLKIKGWKTGIATSAPQANLDLILSSLNLYPEMESLMASEDVLNHKPNPEVYLTSASNLLVDPQDCLVFEDSYSGVMAAKNAGMKVVGVLSTHTLEELPACDHYLNDYAGLDVGLLQEIMSS
jgi:HAD superfamily hydrolase (TIGR01509 family)